MLIRKIKVSNYREWNYREETYREVDIKKENIEEIQTIKYRVKVRCPYCGGDCEYVYDKIPSGSLREICNDGPDGGRWFYINF